MKKILRFLLKSIIIIVAIFGVSFIVLKLIYNEEIPSGTSGQQADNLANKMLDAINHEAFKTAKEIHWTFRGKHRYEWKLQQHKVEVFWDTYHVTYYTQAPENSLVYMNEKEIYGSEKAEALNYAIKNFNNDSFWVIAPFKIFDPGTQRKMVTENGKQKLLVKYTFGGSTPGDAYLWELDENYKPIAFKMWVSIIPFDGIEAQWADWEMTAGNFPLSKSKTIFGLEIPISNLKVIP